MSGCAICGQEFYPPTGALCEEHDAVTQTFTPKMWERVEAMTSEQANDFLRKRQRQLDARRKPSEES